MARANLAGMAGRAATTGPPGRRAPGGTPCPPSCEGRVVLAVVQPAVRLAGRDGRAARRGRRLGAARTPCEAGPTGLEADRGHRRRAPRLAAPAGGPGRGDGAPPGADGGRPGRAGRLRLGARSRPTWPGGPGPRGPGRRPRGDPVGPPAVAGPAGGSVARCRLSRRGDPPPALAIDAAVRALAVGDIVGIPTDTVYGLAADAFRSGASDRLFAVKRRPRTVELPVLVADVAQALSLAVAVPASARRLMDRFWPGAAHPRAAPAPRSQRRSRRRRRPPSGMRCAAHPVPLALCAGVGPLATTSANRHGEDPATTAEALAAALGACRRAGPRRRPVHRRASTVVDCTGVEPRLLCGPAGSSGRGPTASGESPAGRRPERRRNRPAPPARLAEVARDDELFAIIDRERSRQNTTLQLIASENFTSRGGAWTPPARCSPTSTPRAIPGSATTAATWSIDEVEDLARRRACALFGAEHANVQPHSGANANMAVYLALLEPGDTVLGMRLDQGGHLTHGSPVNFSGRLYHFVSYGVDRERRAHRLRRAGGPRPASTGRR